MEKPSCKPKKSLKSIMGTLLRYISLHKWLTEFQCGRTATSDAPRSGRQVEVTTEEIMNKIYDIVLADCRVKVRHNVELLNTSDERARNILTRTIGLEIAHSCLQGGFCYSSAVVTVTLVNFRNEVMPHPPCTPDLSRCDYFRFPNINLKNEKFTSNEHIIAKQRIL